MNWGRSSQILGLILAIGLAGLTVKLPRIFDWQEDLFLQRNISFILVPWAIMILNFIRSDIKKLSLIGGLIIALGAVWINSLFPHMSADVLLLTVLFLPLIMWFGYGYIWTSGHWRSWEQRLKYLKFNGDLLVLSAVLGLTGLLLMLVSFALYELIGIEIKDIHVVNVITWGAPAVPLTASYLLLLNPNLVRGITPLVAKLFSPLALIVLITFTVGLVWGTEVMNQERQTLLVLNVVIVCVLALILFSVGTTDSPMSKGAQWLVLLLLSLVIFFDDVLALTSVVKRVVALGLTANRTAVLGTNLLTCVHLFLLTKAIWLSRKRNAKSDHASGEDLSHGDQTISRAIVEFLPIYALWAALICLLFPWIF